MCIRILIENGVLPAICSRGGAPITTTELASSTGVEELLIREQPFVQLAISLDQELQIEF